MVLHGFWIKGAPGTQFTHPVYGLYYSCSTPLAPGPNFFKILIKVLGELLLEEKTTQPKYPFLNPLPIYMTSIFSNFSNIAHSFHIVGWIFVWCVYTV
jgi:hypothetical protein